MFIKIIFFEKAYNDTPVMMTTIVIQISVCKYLFFFFSNEPELFGKIANSEIRQRKHRMSLACLEMPEKKELKE